MSTVHETFARGLLEQMQDSPIGRQNMAFVQHSINCESDESYLDMLGQHPWHSASGSWAPEQLACMTALHSDITEGRIATACIKVGAEPGPDREREENAALLATLPHPFKADLSLTQHMADSDGGFRWTKGIQVHVQTGTVIDDPDGVPRSDAVRVPIKPMSVALEVGSTLPSRTIWHMRREFGVARWPYGSDVIWLMVNHKLPVRWTSSGRRRSPSR